MNNPQLAAFWATLSRDPAWSPAHLTAVQEIIAALDCHGDCPSVVQGEWAGGPGQAARNDYDRLAQIPLWSHSVHVTKLIAPMAPPADRPNLVIAALAHDLGKVPVCRGPLYAGRQHAIMIDVAIDELCPSVKRLTHYRRIRNAIADHHRPHSGEPWTATLKKADHAARQAELAEIERATR